MAGSPTNKRKLIVLETDGVTVARVRRIAGTLYDVYVEREAERALERVLTDSAVAVLIAGASGDGSSAVAILERIQSARPDVLRVMLASPGHLGAVVQGLHSGAVERPAQKPIDEHELFNALVTPRAGAPVSSAAALAR
jgi:ActR/RegA family two-component response regulator